MKLILLLLCSTVVISLYSQEDPATATVKDSIHRINNRYVYKDKILYPKQVNFLINSVPEAKAVNQPGRTQKTLAGVLGGVGGFMVGYNIGHALFSPKRKFFQPQKSYTIGVIGGILIVAAIPLEASSKKIQRKAVDEYNRHVIQ